MPRLGTQTDTQPARVSQPGSVLATLKIPEKTSIHAWWQNLNKNREKGTKTMKNDDRTTITVKDEYKNSMALFKTEARFVKSAAENMRTLANLMERLDIEHPSDHGLIEIIPQQIMDNVKFIREALDQIEGCAENIEDLADVVQRG